MNWKNSLSAPTVGRNRQASDLRDGSYKVNNSWSYTNPVQIIFGEDSFQSLPERIAARPYCLVTYSDNVLFGQLEQRLA